MKIYLLGVASGIALWWIAAETWAYFTFGPGLMDKAVEDLRLDAGLSHADHRLPRLHNQ